MIEISPNTFETKRGLFPGVVPPEGILVSYTWYYYLLIPNLYEYDNAGGGSAKVTKGPLGEVDLDCGLASKERRAQKTFYLADITWYTGTYRCGACVPRDE